jgi:pyruvate/2-oxoglutarate dehydrogenase complex dihydrolipoamide acyltransferase (E2) component
VSSSRTEQQTLIDVTMPQMGVSVAEGTVVGWRVGVGDPVEAEKTICEISTDKIDTEVPAPVSGVVREILVDVDTTVPVGTVLARIEAGGRAGTTGGGASPRDLVGPEAGVRDGEPAGAGRSGASGNGSRRYSPVVRRIAAEHGVDLSQVTGTGRGGRVRKQDVLAFLGAAGTREAPLHTEGPYRPEPSPAPEPRVTTQPATATPPSAAVPGQLSRMRRLIGEHMKRSLETAATCTTWIEADMSRVEAARAKLGVTALAFVARACIDALREFPTLNAWLEDERFTVHQPVTLGIAVSLGADGLIVPVIHNAHELSVEGLAARIHDLAGRARGRRLSPDEVRGGTFTITNPGQYGSIMATPIINQPQVAILDFEATIKRPVVVTDADGNDSIAIRPVTILGLSWDHRALDGAIAAQFLAAVKRRLEQLSSA